MIPCPMCGLRPWPHQTEEQIEKCEAIMSAWEPKGLFANLTPDVIPIRRECVCDSDACVEWCYYCATIDETAACPVAGA